MVNSDQPAGDRSMRAELGSGISSDDSLAVSRAAARFFCMKRLYVGSFHELRSPLNSIVMNAAVLSESLAVAAGSVVEDRLGRYVQALERESERLNRQIHLFLAQIAPPDTTTRDSDVVEIVRDVAAVVAAQAKQQRARVTVDAPAEGPRVAADSSVLRDIVMLLAVHLLPVTAPGGSLRMIVRNGAGKTTVRLAVEFGEDGDADSGTGSTVSPTEHAFEAAFLLAVAESLVQRVGAALSAEPDGDRATAYELRFAAE